MKAFGIICSVIIAMIVIAWIYRKIVIGRKYARTIGEIINFKNMVPLVSKTMANRKGKYLYTECKYQGDAFVVVRFVDGNGREISRRFNASEPLILKINEHERSVSQYTSVFAEWQLGGSVKVYYNPADTTDIYVGRVPSFQQAKKQRL